MRAIISTRPLGAADPLSHRLTELGYKVHAVPTVITEPCADTSELDAAARQLAAYDWVVLTSAMGVRVLFDRLEAIGIARPKAPPPRWAAVGPATAEELRSRGLRVEAVPDATDSAAIAEAVERHGPLRGLRFLLARADRASDDLPRLLAQAGASVDECVAYRTIVGPESAGPSLKAALDDPQVGAVVFASGSAVRGFIKLAGSHADYAQRVPAISIGPKTTAVAREHGFTVVAEAAMPSVEALAAVIVAAVPPAPSKTASREVSHG